MSFDISSAFRTQATGCEKLGSPFMYRLMTLCADRLQVGSVVSDRVLGWKGDPRPQADNVPLRLAGALHALRIEGLALDGVYPPHVVSDDVLWAAVVAAMDDHPERILHWLDSAPQTNEVRRSAVILPALALAETEFGCPMEMLELGTSGGLNLFADQFHLDLPGATLGVVGSAVRLLPKWTGPLPPEELPQITARSGVDLNPLDPANTSDRVRLLAYLWPDQQDRLDRTRAAIEVAAQSPLCVAKGDAGEWLGGALTAPATVGRFVFHTIAAQYFPPETQSAVTRALLDAGARATKEQPLVHLSVEADGGQGAGVVITMWPGGERREIARADFHGRWVNWTGL